MWYIWFMIWNTQKVLDRKRGYSVPHWPGRRGRRLTEQQTWSLWPQHHKHACYTRLVGPGDLFSLLIAQRGDHLSLRAWLNMWPLSAVCCSISCNSSEIGSQDDGREVMWDLLRHHLAAPLLWWRPALTIVMSVFWWTEAAAEEWRSRDVFWWRTVFAQSCSTDEHWGSGV